MTGDMNINEQCEWLKLDLELNAIYYQRRIAFLQTVDTVNRMLVFISGSAAIAGLVVLMAKVISPTVSVWVSSVAAGILAVLNHIQDRMEIKLSIYRYEQFKRKTQVLLSEIRSEKELSTNDFIRFTERQKEITSEEPSTYRIVYYLARNQLVRSLSLVDAGTIYVPWWRHLLAHYFYQTSYEPQPTYSRQPTAIPTPQTP